MTKVTSILAPNYKMLEFQIKAQQLESDMVNLSTYYWQEFMKGDRDGEKEKV